jgi:nitroimidazol reductase NimA-like FMN-containing flavoprotein (pyridoxamine 5'-phosphate oxidase superfamily)
LSIRTLNRQECFERLAEVPIGRVAIAVGALPAIVPVSFWLRGESVLFGARCGSMLARATDGTIVAFQCDRYCSGDQSGWTVMGVGPAAPVDDPEALEAWRAPDQWPVGEAADRLIAIQLPRLSGHLVTPDRP